jgi:hypothetical protein
MSPSPTSARKAKASPPWAILRRSIACSSSSTANFRRDQGRLGLSAHERICRFCVSRGRCAPGIPSKLGWLSDGVTITTRLARLTPPRCSPRPFHEGSHAGRRMSTSTLKKKSVAAVAKKTQGAATLDPEGSLENCGAGRPVAEAARRRIEAAAASPLVVSSERKPGARPAPADIAGHSGNPSVRRLNRAIVMRPAMTESGDAQGTMRCYHCRRSSPQ